MTAGRFHKGFSSEKRMSYRPQALERMIEKELFYQEAVKRKLTIDEALIEKEREKTIKRLGGKDNYTVALKRAGLSNEQYRSNLRRKHLIERIIDVEVKDKAKASDKDVKSYYEKNKKRYMRPEARKITHILIKVAPTATAEERKLKKARAQKVIDEIKAGKDMSVIAWDYSDGKYRVKGGDLGLVHRGRLDPDLEKEVFQLEPNQLSNIIETRYGYHVVRVEEIKASEQLDLKDVSKRINKELTEKKEKQLRKTLVEKLKTKAQIEIY
jgi:peptidyl-prolyl cis-trans isomerase C